MLKQCCSDNKITKRGTEAASIIDGPGRACFSLVLTLFYTVCCLLGAVWMWRSALITRSVRKPFLARVGLERAAGWVAGRDTTND